MTDRPQKKSLTISGHRTSISLETAFWQALTEIAGAEGKTISVLVTEIDQGRGDGGLSSAIRVWILDRYKKKQL